MDMGIIASLKTNYKTKLSRDKTVCLKNNSKFNVSVLDAMCILDKSWKDVKESTIIKCFTKAHFNQE